ncbi:protocadherin-like wing polarity protein stan [Trichonephila clavipes]|nr:protocadherin-like wing polarity protein stan [Trichonephila clavipes]
MGSFRTLLWLAVILLPIQGSTWVLAILSVNETHAILHYAFSFFCLLEGIYIFVGYCVINKKIQQQICWMWMRIIKHDKYTEKNGIHSPMQQSAAYHPSSKIYHRSIGISTSSAASRSTSKTCTSHCRAESEPRLSENQPSTSELDEGIYCKHGKCYQQILRTCDLEQNKGSIKCCLNDILNGNHTVTSCKLSLSAETNDGKSSEGFKFSESTSSGPKMGVNMFSYPRSRSPFSKTSLSLKMGLNSKDQSVGSVDCEKSSPLSAPVSNVRPEFYAPRMGVSGVEKSIHSVRDILAETNSFDSNLHLNSANKLDFKTGICSSCRSQSFSRETFSDFSSTDIPQYDVCSKSSYKNYSIENNKSIHLSKEKDFNRSKKQLHNYRSLEDSENFMDEMSINSGVSGKKLNEALKKTRSSGELEWDSSQVSKGLVQTSFDPTQRTVETASCGDRASPRLIDDTPSEEDGPINTKDLQNSRNDRSCDSSNLLQIVDKPSKTSPPLATAEITDSEVELKTQQGNSIKIEYIICLWSLKLVPFDLTSHFEACHGQVTRTVTELAPQTFTPRHHEELKLPPIELLYTVGVQWHNDWNRVPRFSPLDCRGSREKTNRSLESFQEHGM